MKKYVIASVMVAAMICALVFGMHEKNYEERVAATATDIAAPQVADKPDETPAPPLQAAPEMPTTGWFSADSSFTECFESKGPSNRIESFSPSERPTVNESKDANGAIYKVEIVGYNHDLTETVWTYYRSKDACENEEINANQNIANKYR